MFAAASGNVEITRFLCDKGSSTLSYTMVDGLKMNAYAVAVKSHGKNSAVAKFLETLPH